MRVVSRKIPQRDYWHGACYEKRAGKRLAAGALNFMRRYTPRPFIQVGSFAPVKIHKVVAETGFSDHRWKGVLTQASVD
jgi:hypothetical protein